MHCKGEAFKAPGLLSIKLPCYKGTAVGPRDLLPADGLGFQVVVVLLGKPRCHLLDCLRFGTRVGEVVT